MRFMRFSTCIRRSINDGEIRPITFFAIGTFFLGMGLEAFIKGITAIKLIDQSKYCSQVILYTTDGTDPFIHGNLCWHDVAQ